MKQQMARSVHWLANLALIVTSFYFMLHSYPIHLVQALELGTLVAIAGPALVLLCGRKRWSIAFDADLLLSGLALVTLSLVITVGAVDTLPTIVNLRTVYAVHLDLVYRAMHYAFVAYVTVWLLLDRPGLPKAETGVVAILIFSALNGGFFLIDGERFALLYGLSLTTALIHLRESPRDGARRGWPPHSLPILLFLLVGLAATAASLYVHNSLERWFRLGNWVLVFFLIVNIVRESQVRRLLAVMLAMAGIVSAAGLVGVAGFAARAGWADALRDRLWVAGVYSNGVAMFTVTYITLGVGWILAPTETWRRRIVLSLAVVPLLLCTLLTYSRSAQLGLLCGLVVLFALGKTGRALFRLLCGSLWLARGGNRAPQAGDPPASGGTGGRGGILAGLRGRKALALGLLLLLPVLLLVLSTLIRTRAPQSVLTSRFYQWKVVLNTLRHRPLLGVGLGNHFVPAYSDVLSYQELRSIEHLVGTHSHNLLLEIGEAMGWLGVGLFLWLLIAALRHGLSAMREVTASSQRSLLLALGAACVALLVPHALILSLSAATLLPVDLWVLLAMFVAVSRTEPQDGKAEQAGQGNSRAKAQPVRQGRTILWLLLILIGLLLAVVRPWVASLAQRKGMAAWMQGDIREAGAALEQAAWLQPFDAELQALLGDLATGGDAIYAYRRAVTLRPDYAPYHARLGWLYWAQNEFEPALAEFEQAVMLDWYGLDGGQHYTDLGLAYAAAGRDEEALDTFREAVLLDPAAIRTPDWRSTGGEVVLSAAYPRYAAMRQVDKALAQLIAYHLGRPGTMLPASDLEGASPFALQDVTRELLAEAQWVPESGSWERSTRALRHLAELCVAWDQAQTCAQTLTVFQEFVERGVAPEHELHDLRGAAYRRQGSLQQARAEFQASLALYDAPSAHHALGLTYVQQGQLPQGIAELEQAAHAWDPSVRYEPAWPRYWAGLADAYWQAARWDEAIAAYRMSQFLELAFAPHLEYQLTIGEVYHDWGDHGREMASYVHAVEILAAGAKLDAQTQGWLGLLATRIAVAYREQGVTAETALAEQERLLSASRAMRGTQHWSVEQAYLWLLRQEIESRLP